MWPRGAVDLGPLIFMGAGRPSIRIISVGVIVSYAGVSVGFVRWGVLMLWGRSHPRVLMWGDEWVEFRASGLRDVMIYLVWKSCAVQSKNSMCSWNEFVGNQNFNI